MIKAIQVTMWETPDGEQFTTQEEAVAHMARSSFRDWYENDNEIYVDSRHASWDDVADWLRENREHVLAFLKEA